MFFSFSKNSKLERDKGRGDGKRKAGGERQAPYWLLHTSI